MTTSKPTRAWAVFTPQGRLMVETVSTSRRKAIARACFHSPGLWSSMQKEGYTVRRVTVQEEAK